MKKTESKLMDSSAWLSYFFATNKQVKDIIESSSIIYTSVISIFEIKRKLMRDGFEGNLEEVFAFIENRSIVINLDEDISQSAADLSLQYKLHAMDALIYASAKAIYSELVTADSDFEKLDDVFIIQQEL
jgi:predicted nucleic acid-binding protein